MEEFFNDVVHHVEGYYKAIVAITPKLLLGIVILLISWFIATRIGIFAGSRLRKKMHDPLLATFIANLLKAILIVAGILFMFSVMGLYGIANTLLTGAGIGAFVIGFALKDIGENFLAGILLAFKRPFSIGDIIESNGVKGKSCSHAPAVNSFNSVSIRSKKFISSLCFTNSSTLGTTTFW